MRKKMILASLALMLLSRLSKGNDTFATLGAGGLVAQKTTQVVMESEDLQISPHQIVVRYVFRNVTNKDVDAVVAFPLPDLDGGAVENEPMRLPDNSQPNFVDFTVTSDGKPIAAKMESIALLNGRNITARLQAAHLPISVMVKPLNDGIAKLSHAEIKKLESEELIAYEEYAVSTGGEMKREAYAAWTMRVKFYWTQHFPANQTVELTQTYKPVVGGSYITRNNDGSSIAKDYCGGPQSIHAIAQVKQAHPSKSDDDIILWEQTIKYILTTANNWSGPIRKFHLTVTSNSAEDIVLTCMPGLKRTADTRYELSHTDWHPTKDLDLLILQTTRPEGK